MEKMKIHYNSSFSDYFSVRTDCGVWVGETSGITKDCDKVTCDKCLENKDQFTVSDEVDWSVIGPKLLECLEWYVKHDETNEGDEPLRDYGGQSWDEVNAYWIEGLNKARAVIEEAKRISS